MLRVILIGLFLGLGFISNSQYSSVVESKASRINGEEYGIIKLSRKDNHVKVKYFAAKDFYGTSVYERYLKWSVGKKVIAYSSGTYMNYCDVPGYATPIGLCIDQGRIVNRELVNGNLDALAIVYATGGMVASDLDAGNLKVKDKDGNSKTLNIRSSAYQKADFINWAEENEATVFQTHLYVFEDKMRIGINSSNKAAPRRFLAVCKRDNGEIFHYIINLPTSSTEYNGVTKAYKILREAEDAGQIVFLINLDTGCQNVFSAFDSNSNVNGHRLLQGTESLSTAINLLAYYYE